MNMPGTDRPFIVIGENIHTTRVLLRKGQLVGDCGGDQLVIWVLKDHTYTLAYRAELGRSARRQFINQDLAFLGYV